MIIRLLIVQRAGTSEIAQNRNALRTGCLQPVQGLIINKLILGRITHLLKAAPIRAVLLRRKQALQLRLGIIRAATEIHFCLARQLKRLCRKAQQICREPKDVVILVARVVRKTGLQIEFRARSCHIVAMAIVANADANVLILNGIHIIHAVLQGAGQNQLQAHFFDIVVGLLLLIVRARVILKQLVVDSRELQIGGRDGRGERALSVFANHTVLRVVCCVIAQPVEGLHDPELARREHADTLVCAVCADVAAGIAVHGRHLIHVDLIAADGNKNLARRLAVLPQHLNGRPNTAVIAAFRIVLIATAIIGCSVCNGIVGVIEHTAVPVRHS